MSRPTLISKALLSGALSASIAAPAFGMDDMAESDGQDRRTIIVTGERQGDANPNSNPDAPYKVEKSANSKFTEPLRDTPKSVTVIPKEVIEDIGATSFREVVRSTPGVTLGTGEGGNAFGDRIFIRGFDARNDVYIDGLRDPGVSSREIFGVEQIEVIKGPSGNFGGRGTTGGLVSLQSKRPQFGNEFAVVEGSIGTENHYRGTIDANVMLIDSLAVRVNTMYHDADTPGRDFVETDKKGTAIALGWNPINGLLITADYYHFRLYGTPDWGHPFDATASQPYEVDRDNFYGVIGRDFMYNGADIGTFAVEYDPIDALSLRSITRYGETYNRYLAGPVGAVCRFTRTATGACPATGTLLPESGEAAMRARATVQQALAQSGLFLSAALPHAIYPPLFNRYAAGDGFGDHVDNAIRVDPLTGVQMRTDLSATLFLTDPNEYDGGELVIQGAFGSASYKLPAGHMLLYPSTSIHHVTEVACGERICSFFWIESLVRENEARETLFELDQSIQHLTVDRGGNDSEVIRLTQIYHNLIRRWAKG